jgi:hypothetical protein
MEQSQKHYLVDFASRYAAGTRHKTLTAGAALQRLQRLMFDIGQLLALQIEAECKGIHFGAWHTFEAVSFFSVGFITCLEWHARSRLVDLMAFDPTCIAHRDVKNIADLALSQMVAEGATIPHLLGAATNVSSAKEYLAIFKRVFEVLNIDFDVERKMRSVKTDIPGPHYHEGMNLYTIVEYLFKYRNHLAHEIDRSIIGHSSLRDIWDLPRARNYALATEACIRMIEAQITQHAPKHFPNRLDAEGTPEDDVEKLSTEVAALEVEITPQIERWGTIDQSESVWGEALLAAKASRDLELKFLEKAAFLRPVRHTDVNRDVQIEYLKNRLSFLILLKTLLDNV